MGYDKASTIRRLASAECSQGSAAGLPWSFGFGARARPSSSGHTITFQIRHRAKNDRMTQRYRSEAVTLAALAEKDAVLVGQAELLRSMPEGVAGRRCWRADERSRWGLRRLRRR
ncbi:hypothetical protein [Mesorhizobium erdmanii]|uniref:hypothetical protein n=1 Tax=Mesorhizobium erdmanii TaxID=1777866 RepID=UPI0012DB6F0D|nr:MULTISPECIES: hypothetical protein [Mesorhizobium]